MRTNEIITLTMASTFVCLALTASVAVLKKPPTIDVVWVHQFGIQGKSSSVSDIVSEASRVVAIGEYLEIDPQQQTRHSVYFRAINGADGLPLSSPAENFGTSLDIISARSIVTSSTCLNDSSHQTPQCGFYVVGGSTNETARSSGADSASDAESIVYLAEFLHEGTLVGTPHLLSSSTAWSEPFGIARVYDVNTQAVDSVVIVGMRRDSDKDGFAQKLNVNTLVTAWDISFGAIGKFDAAKAVAVDQSGSTYVVGYTYGSIGFSENCRLRGSSDAFVLKLNPAGNVRWCHQMGEVGKHFDANDIAYDASCNTLYVVGSVADATNNKKSFIASYDSQSGRRRWFKYDLKLKSSSSVATSVATAGDSCRAYVCGEMLPSSQIVTNAFHSFVSIWSKDSNKLLTKIIKVEPQLLNGFSTVIARAIALHPPRTAFIGGLVDGSLYQEKPRGGPGNTDGFVIKLQMPSEPATIRSVDARVLSTGAHGLLIGFNIPLNNGAALLGFDIQCKRGLSTVYHGEPVFIQFVGDDSKTEGQREELTVVPTHWCAKHGACVARVRAVNTFGAAQWSSDSNEVTMSSGQNDQHGAAPSEENDYFLLLVYVGISFLGCVIPCILVFICTITVLACIYRTMQLHKLSEGDEVERNRLINMVEIESTAFPQTHFIEDCKESDGSISSTSERDARDNVLVEKTRA